MRCPERGVIYALICLTDRRQPGTDVDVSDGISVEQRLTALEAQVSAVTQERDEYRKLVLHLREENERLKRGLLGQKAERLPKNDAQLSLLMLGLALGAGDAETPAPSPPPSQVVAEHTRAKPVRRPLPDNLPRERIELVSPDVERDPTPSNSSGPRRAPSSNDGRPPPSSSRSSTRSTSGRIGTGMLRWKCGRRIRSTCPSHDSVAGPTLLADTVVRRWQDNQPLNRLEGIYGREGLPIPKSTLCTWHEQLAELVAPLVEAMRADAMKAPYLCVDATGVLVQAKERCRTGHFWVTVTPGKHVLFRYTRRHDSAAVDGLLPGYSGYLVTDAHAVYDHLYRKGDIIEVGCWAHARRYFFKALESDPDRAKTALAWIAALFALERSMVSTPAKKKRELRQARAAPITDAFFAWCHAEADRVLDQSPIAQAIGYARNQQVALHRFLDDGRLPLHNNISELTFAVRSSAERTGSSWAATTAPRSTPSSSRSWPVAASTSSNRSPISATCCASCPAGQSIACSNSRPPTGARRSSSATLSRPSKPTSFVASSSAFPPVSPIAQKTYPIHTPPSPTRETELLPRSSSRRGRCAGRLRTCRGSRASTISSRARSAATVTWRCRSFTARSGPKRCGSHSAPWFSSRALEAPDGYGNVTNLGGAPPLLTSRITANPDGESASNAWSLNFTYPSTTLKIRTYAHVSPFVIFSPPTRCSSRAPATLLTAGPPRKTPEIPDVAISEIGARRNDRIAIAVGSLRKPEPRRSHASSYTIFKRAGSLH